MGSGGKLATAYANLIKDIWIGKESDDMKRSMMINYEPKQKRIILPHNFKSTLEKYAPQFQGYNQHDAQELISYLLDGMHEDLNRVKKSNNPHVEDEDCDGDCLNDDELSMQSWSNHLLRNESIIVDLFQGQLKNTLQCNICDYQSVKFEPFMYLSLPVASDQEGSEKRAKSLNECLELYCKQEVLDGDNLWYCPKCSRNVSAVKKLDLWMIPPILIIHLKRFKVYTSKPPFYHYATTNRRTRVKQNHKIQYPTNLDLSHIIQRSRTKGRKRFDRIGCICGTEPVYKLYAMLHHVGDLSSGHYTAQALNRIDNRWYDFNDSCVSELDIALDSSDDSNISSSSAYCLFYTNEEQSTPPELWPKR